MLYVIYTAESLYLDDKMGIYQNVCSINIKCILCFFIGVNDEGYVQYLQGKEGWLIGLCCLTPLSTIFQLYCGSQFYCKSKPEYPEKTTDLL